MTAPGDLPAPVRVRLDGGLVAIAQPHDAAPVAAVQLWVRAGGRDEGPGEAGLSHFIEHLLFKGTPARGPGQIDRTVAELGGEMNAATSHDWTCFHVVLPAGHLPTALDVLADAARHALFDPVELERERLVVLEEIRRAEDSPTAVLWRLLAARHFGEHPYGRPVLGGAESIRGVSREGVLAYHRRHYRPGAATVVVAGPGAPEEMLEATRAAFAGWEATGDPAGGPGPPGAAPDGGGVRRVAERRPLRQTHVALAWRGPSYTDEDVYALELASGVLGQGRSSRLTQALRERRGLVQGVGARFHLQRETGTFVVTARTATAPAPLVEAAVLAEIAALRDELISADELARAVTAVEAEDAFGRETAEGAAHALGLAETSFDLAFELGRLARIRAVTRAEVREAVRRHLDPARFTAAAIGPGEGPA